MGTLLGILAFLFVAYTYTIGLFSVFFRYFSVILMLAIVFGLSEMLGISAISSMMLMFFVLLALNIIVWKAILK